MSSISMFGVVVHDVQRLATIASVLHKFGFGKLVKAINTGVSSDFQSSSEILESFKQQPADTAANLRAAIEELGTTYIKFGQMLSTRYDLLPGSIITELSKLQDGSPRMEFSVIETILNAAYGDYHDIFASIDETPLGAASIAQAHRATLKDGTHVVLKIQRPGLLPLIRSDIDILNIIAKVLDNHIEEIAYFNLPALIDEFERSIVSELDFTHERANIEYFIQKYGTNPMFCFPEPFKDLTRPNILVMREISGKKITTVDADTPQAHRMADALLDIAFDMVFREGIFHADPHPGNVFATPDNTIGLLDFGLVGTFTARQRSEFTRLVMAIHLGDCALIARSLLVLGHPTKRVILDDLEAEIAAILQKHIQTSLQNMDLANFANDFIAAGQKFAVQIPSEFTNAVRAIINLEGIIQYLNPNLNVMATLAQFSKKLISDNFKNENLVNLLFQIGLDVSDFGRSIPSHAAQIMQDLEHDGLAIRLNTEITHPLTDAINSMATRITITFMLIGMTLAIILAMPQRWLLIDIAIGICLLWCIILGFWHFKSKSAKNRLKLNPLLAQMKRRKQWF
ncbi:MAG: AarF/ABC1/UbiB kinase family protein [Proteobacteria bacterium]|nr:AarF/ABC1/UbiB kinase family protein [Pseudomonadota bacterium]